MGTVVQVCIFSIEKLKVEYDDSFYFTYFILLFILFDFEVVDQLSMKW